MLMNGKVTNIVIEKGYGFIEDRKNNAYFFHINDIGKSTFAELEKGMSVEFDSTVSEKGYRAINIQFKRKQKIQNLDLPHIDFSEEQIRGLFGDLAAEDEEIKRFNSFFVKTDTYKKIHNELPIRILVAHKGIGKSAIFRMSYIEHLNNDVLCLWVKPNDISDLGKTSEDIDALELIRQWRAGLDELIIKKIIKNFNLNSNSELLNDVSNKGIRIADRIAKILKIVSDKIDIDETQNLIAEKYLKRNKIIIYIDDLDRAWDGSRQNIARISALLNAIRDMCNESQELCFRISLRSDVYYLVRTADESTDKIDGNIIWLKWTEHELLALLVKRIQSYFGHNLSEEQLLKMSQEDMSGYLSVVMEDNFDGSGKWHNKPIRYVLLSLIRKRPRDLINLCTLAARDANANGHCLIETNDWKDIFEEYSQSRLQDTINEHRYELPEIERLLLVIIPGYFEPPVRVLRATIPENGSH